MLGLIVAEDQAFGTAYCKGNPNFWPCQIASARALTVNIVEALASVDSTILTG